MKDTAWSADASDTLSDGDRKYRTALASIQAERRKSEAMGYAVMGAVSSYGDAVKEGGKLAKAVHFAKVICILFAGVAPCLLMAAHVLG